MTNKERAREVLMADSGHETWEDYVGACDGAEAMCANLESALDEAEGRGYKKTNEIYSTLLETGKALSGHGNSLLIPRAEIEKVREAIEELELHCCASRCDNDNEDSEKSRKETLAIVEAWLK